MKNTPGDSVTPPPLKRPFSSTKILQQSIFMSAILQLIGETLGNLHLMHLKPIPIVLMILLSSYSLDTDPNITRGLLFGLIGDLCLMFPTTFLFEAGAVSFMIGHFFYIRTFTKGQQSQKIMTKSTSTMQHLGAGLIFCILIINSFLLWKYLPNKGLFVLYGIILSSMTAGSFYRVQQKRLSHYWIGIIGAIAFMASDYLIAYSKFMGYQNSMNGAVIMGLYYTGQFMILQGNSRQQVRASE